MSIRALVEQTKTKLLLSAKNSIKNIGYQVTRYRFQLLVSIVIIGVVTWFVVWFVATESTIYFWDYSEYWMKTRALADWAKQDLSSAIQGVIQSIRTDE